MLDRNKFDEFVAIRWCKKNGIDILINLVRLSSADIPTEFEYSSTIVKLRELLRGKMRQKGLEFGMVFSELTYTRVAMARVDTETRLDQKEERKKDSNEQINQKIKPSSQVASFSFQSVLRRLRLLLQNLVFVRSLRVL